MLNLLPFDGTVFYFGKVLNLQMADSYLGIFHGTIDWQEERLRIAGREVVAKRRVAWYGDKPFVYRYTGSQKTALPWTKELLELKHLAEKILGSKYNSCLLNYYPDGLSGVSWHSDDEKSLARSASVASFSFGAQRKFAFKHKSRQAKMDLQLEHGSLLEMKGDTQLNWLHCLPKTSKPCSLRINLTFRQMTEA